MLLGDHPDFELYKLGASGRSAGKKYKDAVTWKQTSLLPKSAEDIIVEECTYEAFKDCDVVFSGLDHDYAGPIEESFSKNGLAVVSNAKNYRRHSDVPLVVPIVNTDHIDIVENRVKAAASQGKTKPGFIICISNCSTAGLVAPLKPLVDKFGPIELLTTTTLQAISGAGFSPGFPGIDILDNIVPYIGGEEEKIEWETKKILANVNAVGDGFDILTDKDIKVSAQCTRVPVSDGHTECISLKFKNRPAPSIPEVKKALADYVCDAYKVGCPSAPEHPVIVLEENDRPQPRLDRDRGNGFAVTVGRVREDPVLDVKMVVLSHNTVIGAAGAGVLIGEYLVKKNII